jgi:hypothetical protein
MSGAHQGQTYVVMAAAAHASMARCRECKAKMLWFVTENGARMPLDIASAEQLDNGQLRCVSHFATCPKAERFRKRKSKPKRSCPTDGCTGTARSGELFCPACWRLVPKALRDEVCHTWKMRQNNAARHLWKAYENAARAALTVVNAKKANGKVQQLDAFSDGKNDPG